MAASMQPKVQYCPSCPACKPGFVFVFGRAKAIHNCTIKELKEWLRVHRTLEDAPLPLAGRKQELVVVVSECIDKGVKHAGTHGQQKTPPNSSPGSSPSLPSLKSHEERRPVPAPQHPSCSESRESGKVESSLARPRSWHDSDEEGEVYDSRRCAVPMKQGVCVRCSCRHRGRYTLAVDQLCPHRGGHTLAVDQLCLHGVTACIQQSEGSTCPSLYSIFDSLCHYTKLL